jgi:deoxyribodipyrimidine photo-lyase
MPSPSAPPCIVWFRDDQRLSDPPALHAASTTGWPVICLYNLSRPAHRMRVCLAARWWLAQSLRALQQRHAAVGASRLLRRRPAAKIVAELARTTGADAVFWNDIAQAPQQALAAQVAAALNEIGIASQSFPGDLLAAPASIREQSGRLAMGRGLRRRCRALFPRVQSRSAG